MQSVRKSAPHSVNQAMTQRPSREEAEAAVRTLLLWVGENPEREGLVNTPKRVIKAYEEMFAGYSQSPEEILGTVFDEVSGYNDPVLIKDIPFYSHCEHHMVPIIGKAHVAYLPDGKVVGLSKIPRVVDVYAKRLQTQESITAQVADALYKYLKPRGVAVLIEAEHMCMAMRGVKKQGSTTITATYRGYYKDNVEAQVNFVKMIRGF